jgi:hypothetical protein
MKKAQMENVLEKYRYRRTDRLQEFLNWLEIFINSLDKFQSSPYNNMQERYCKRYFIS